MPDVAPPSVPAAVGSTALCRKPDGERGAELRGTHGVVLQHQAVLAEEDVGDGEMGENQAAGEDQTAFLSRRDVW